jgi:hypothetical protein
MDTHKNALLTPKGRKTMARSVLEGGLLKAAAAREVRTTPKKAAKWVESFCKVGGVFQRDIRKRCRLACRLDISLSVDKSYNHFYRIRS